MGSWVIITEGARVVSVLVGLEVNLDVGFSDDKGFLVGVRFGANVAEGDGSSAGISEGDDGTRVGSSVWVVDGAKVRLLVEILVGDDVGSDDSAYEGL